MGLLRARSAAPEQPGHGGQQQRQQRHAGSQPAAGSVGHCRLRRHSGDGGSGICRLARRQLGLQPGDLLIPGTHLFLQLLHLQAQLRQALL